LGLPRSFTDPACRRAATAQSYKSGEKFDGKAESDDKRFSAKGDTIVVNAGEGIKQPWTTRKSPKDFEPRWSSGRR